MLSEASLKMFLSVASRQPCSSAIAPSVHGFTVLTITGPEFSLLVSVGCNRLEDSRVRVFNVAITFVPDFVSCHIDGTGGWYLQRS